MSRGGRYLAVVAALTLLGGCGAGGDPLQGRTGETDNTPAPRPAENTDDVLADLRAAAADPTCQRLLIRIHSAYEPIERGLCRSFRRRLEPLAAGAAARARRYGTGMVVDMKLGSERRTAVLALDPSGRFELLFVLDLDTASIGKPPRQAVDLEVEPIMDTILNADCRHFVERAHHSIGLARGPRTEVCSRLAKLSLGRELTASPATRPRRLGSNRAFSFYGITFPSGRSYTMVFAREPLRDRNGSTQRFALVTAPTAR